MGKEVFVLLGLAVVMIVLLLSFSESYFAVTLRQLAGFSAAGKEPADGDSKYPGVCVHGMVDDSVSSVRARDLLVSLGIASIPDRLALMCHLPIEQLSVQVPRGLAHEVSNAYPNRICCVDFDVFFSREGVPMIGRPDLVAKRIVERRHNSSDVAASVTADETASVTRDLLAARVSKAQIQAADAGGILTVPLTDVAAVVQKVLSSQDPGVTHLNVTRFTLELKLDDSAPPPRGLRRGFTPGSSLFVGDAVQIIAATLSRTAVAQRESSGGHRLQLWEYFGVIVDPLRFRKSWKYLMLEGPSMGHENIKSPPGFTVLATQPQLWYLVPLKDAVLQSIADGAASSVEGGELTTSTQKPFTAAVYCSWILQPPSWARERMPSVGFLQRCIKWFDVAVDRRSDGSFTVALEAKSRVGKKIGRKIVADVSWRDAMRRLSAGSRIEFSSNVTSSSNVPAHQGTFAPAPQSPHFQSSAMVTWIVDTLDDYLRVVALGERDGVRSAFVVSNNAQQLSSEVKHYYNLA